MQFDQVSLSDVRSGVQDCLKKGPPEGLGNAAYFDVEVGGKLFPPKIIIAQFGDGDYPEAFCHFTGEPSYGDTSYHRPILQKNWRKAKKWID